MTNAAWNPIAAALADTEKRALWARLVLGEQLAASAFSAKERRRFEALERAGLAEVRDGVAHPLAPFDALLPHRAAASGIERFVRDGRIAQRPARPADRAALLLWAAGRALGEDERADEATVTTRLTAISDDAATLRRDLCDAGLLDRSADGAQYWRA